MNKWFFRRHSKNLVEDPVCHMSVDAERPAGGNFVHHGVEYGFCGRGCNRAFQKDPEAFLSGEKKIDM